MLRPEPQHYGTEQPTAGPRRASETPLTSAHAWGVPEGETRGSGVCSLQRGQITRANQVKPLFKPEPAKIKLQVRMWRYIPSNSSSLGFLHPCCSPPQHNLDSCHCPSFPSCPTGLHLLTSRHSHKEERHKVQEERRNQDMAALTVFIFYNTEGWSKTSHTHVHWELAKCLPATHTPFYAVPTLEVGRWRPQSKAPYPKAQLVPSSITDLFMSSSLGTNPTGLPKDLCFCVILMCLCKPEPLYNEIKCFFEKRNIKISGHGNICIGVFAFPL